ncbi:MAG TPA: class I SAM-dependent methyltransferase, partial [Vicinamibacterales bacterium]
GTYAEPVSRDWDAAAYDRLPIPMTGWGETVLASLELRGDERVLDAGCGTGRYAWELARRGYRVHGVDVSPELLDIASQSGGDRVGTASFTVGNMLSLPPRRYDAILSRGVLNDFVEDADRHAVFSSLARAMRPSGALVFDVREWDASAARKRQEPLFRKRVESERGLLTFTSVTELDVEHRRLVVSERHTLARDGQERSSDYVFVMRCWTREELAETFASHGFDRIAYFGGYDAAIEAGRTDRIVAVAQRSAEPAKRSAS